MNRNLLRALLGSTSNVPTYLLNQAWTQAIAGDDTELAAAVISSPAPVGVDIRTQMATHPDPKLRIAYLERADVGAAEAARMLESERRLTVLLGTAKRWDHLDSHHQAVMAAANGSDNAMAVVTALTPEQFTCAEGSELLAALPVGSIRNADMFSPVGRWLSELAGPAVSTVLGAPDVDERYSDAALAHLLCAPGRDDEAMAADTSAVMAHVGGRIHTILSHYMVEFVGHTGESHLVCAHVQAMAAQHNITLGLTRLGELPARLAVTPATTHRLRLRRYLDAATWTRRDPPEADTLLLAAVQPPGPTTTRAVLHTYDSHNGGRNNPSPVLAGALIHPDAQIASFGWAYAVAENVDIDPDAYACALRQHGTDAGIRISLIQAITATAVSAHTLNDVNITLLSDLVDQLHRHSENTTATNRYRVEANYREVASVLALRGRPGELNWARLHCNRLQLSPDAHTAWTDWLVDTVSTTEAPERTWTVIGGLADSFTGSSAALVAAAADIIAGAPAVESAAGKDAGKWQTVPGRTRSQT